MIIITEFAISFSCIRCQTHPMIQKHVAWEMRYSNVGRARCIAARLFNKALVARQPDRNWESPAFRVGEYSRRKMCCTYGLVTVWFLGCRIVHWKYPPVVLGLPDRSPTIGSCDVEWCDQHFGQSRVAFQRLYITYWCVGKAYRVLARFSMNWQGLQPMFGKTSKKHVLQPMFGKTTKNDLGPNKSKTCATFGDIWRHLATCFCNLVPKSDILGTKVPPRGRNRFKCRQMSPDVARCRPMSPLWFAGV